MFGYILPIAGILLGILIIDQREFLGDFFGETKWLHEHGGIYNWMIVLGLFICFWSFSELIGITHYVFDPIRSVLPGLPEQTDEVFIP